MRKELPLWLTENEERSLPAVGTGLRRADYLEKTLADIQAVMAEDMYQAGLATSTGFLQRLEPRIKVAGVVLLIFAVAMTRSLGALLAMHGLLIVLALWSGMSLAAYVKRAWLPALLFAGVAVLPGMINWITPGEALVTIYQGLNWKFGSFVMPAELTVTKQGALAVCFVWLRATASLGLAVLLMKTTRWAVLTKALGSIGLTQVFVMVLDLTYRYLFLFLLLLTDYILGRKSRLVALERHQNMIAWIGGALAGFFRMVWEYSQEISAAMQARGYTGENRLVLDSPVGTLDVCFISAVILICIGMWGGLPFVSIFSF